MQSYGKVTLKLAALMDARGITRNRLARLVNTRYEVVDKWYKGHVEKLDLDVWTELSSLLSGKLRINMAQDVSVRLQGCSVQDLLEYTET